MNDKYLHSIPQDFGTFSEILLDSSKSERYTLICKNNIKANYSFYNIKANYSFYNIKANYSFYSVDVKLMQHQIKTTRDMTCT